MGKLCATTFFFYFFIIFIFFCVIPFGIFEFLVGIKGGIVEWNALFVFIRTPNFLAS